jgi:hypothetical protein
MGADGASTAAPKLSGSVASYPGAWPNTDLNYQVGSQGLKESVVLAKAPAGPASYSFTVTLSGGLTPNGVLSGEERALDVHGHDRVPVLDAHVLDKHADRSGDASAADEHVNAVVLRGDRVQDGAYCVGVGDVGTPGCGGGAVDDHHRRAFGGERGGTSCADAGRTVGDHDDASGQSQIHAAHAVQVAASSRGVVQRDCAGPMEMALVAQASVSQLQMRPVERWERKSMATIPSQGTTFSRQVSG